MDRDDVGAGSAPDAESARASLDVELNASAAAITSYEGVYAEVPLVKHVSPPLAVSLSSNSHGARSRGGSG